MGRPRRWNASAFAGLMLTVLLLWRRRLVPSHDGPLHTPQQRSGQIDVGWAPTPVAAAERALDWASIGPGDVVFELGCGDGRVAIAAARRGADRVLCIDADPARAALARSAVDEAGGLDGRVEVRTADLFDVDLRPATLVFFFLLPSVNYRLRPRLTAQLRPGTRVVSREFHVPGWPCGERLVVPGFLFMKWEMPIVPLGVEADDESCAKLRH